MYLTSNNPFSFVFLSPVKRISISVYYYNIFSLLFNNSNFFLRNFTMFLIVFYFDVKIKTVRKFATKLIRHCHLITLNLPFFSHLTTLSVVLIFLGDKFRVLKCVIIGTSRVSLIFESVDQNRWYASRNIFAVGFQLPYLYIFKNTIDFRFLIE